MSAAIWLEGEPCQSIELRVNTGLNFGRIFPEQTTASFRMEVTLADLNWLAQEWQSTALEMAVDDQLDDDPSPFHLLSYDPRLTCVEMFFTRPILNQFFACADNSGSWTINGVSSIHVPDDHRLAC